MLSDIELTQYSYIVSSRFEAVNTKYIKLMGEHIRKIGTLSATDLHRLEQMTTMQQNIAEINQMLLKETGKTLKELYSIYDDSGMGVYGSSAELFKANGKSTVPFLKNTQIQDYLASMKSLTLGTFLNLSNTTSIQQQYKNAVDIAVQAVSSGVTDYKSSMRRILRDNSTKGMRVQYASGNTRRLDSAVRMNILEGVRRTNIGVREISGQQFGADGVEISTHGLCAKDHLDIQGHQYSKKAFFELNESLSRQIGTCNCHHYTFPIILGVSQQTNTQEELDQIKTYSTKKVNVLGKEMNRYEASQCMRKIETSMRYAKDRVIMGRTTGDKILEQEGERKLTHLQTTYRQVSKESGLQKRYDRAYVPDYRGKATNNKPVL